MYTLHGHLGGVLLLATTGLGDTLVSVGIDRVAKVAMGRQTSCWLDLFTAQVWKLHGRLLAPTRWLALVPGLTSACLSSDSHLLITTGARLQEVKTKTLKNLLIL